MKLRNKKTGEIVERIDLVIREESVVFNADEQYTSLAELNEEWEDYEEPEGIYYITERGGIEFASNMSKRSREMMVAIGNCFETKEEAERAVRKLKAWKRLKDGGFRFTNVYRLDFDEKVGIQGVSDIASVHELWDALDELFGGEDE